MSAAVSDRRQILVVGAGAIGGLYATCLAAEADVTVLDVNGAHVEAMRHDGLKLTGRTELTRKLNAYGTPADMGRRRLDAVIMLVKSRATETAFRSILSFIDGRPLLVTFQNGMGNEELLAGLCDYDIAHGVCYEAARYDGPGKIFHMVTGETSFLGPARGPMESVLWLGELLTRCGLATRVLPDVRSAMWGKLIFNSVMNPLGAIMLGVSAARYEVPEVCALIDQMGAECLRVAEAAGVTLEGDPLYLVKKIRSGAMPLTKHAGSMALDIAAGRETEIDALTGYVVKKARELGVPVPALETVYRVVKGVEHAALAIKAQGAA